ncbi:MAG: hypothetical protein MZV64_01345 [Ignavibacteriales bacterium]|nr:hypothetical protein [Ignavibacteriales bacterium]
MLSQELKDQEVPGSLMLMVMLVMFLLLLDYVYHLETMEQSWCVTRVIDGIIDTVYSVVITPVDRPGGGEGGGGKSYTFEPIPGFADPCSG